MAKPVCFMIMPFGTRKTAGTPGLPAEIDFDALWFRAFEPALKQLDFMPMRADQDLSALIIPSMLESIVLSDLVLADMTLPNGNVYYEVGVRHAAVRNKCVLIGAEGSEPLFDVKQMRRKRYPLPKGELADSDYQAIIDTLVESVPKLMIGDSPVYQTLPGYPDKLSAARQSFATRLSDELSLFRGNLSAACLAPKLERADKVRKLGNEFARRKSMQPFVALELLQALRDCAGWESAVEFIKALPEDLRQLPVVREQEYLALAKSGDARGAIGALKSLVESFGDSSERQGLLGGRFKQLFMEESRGARSVRELRPDVAIHLDDAINHYDKGMLLDLNAYYPSSNLQRLLRWRRGQDDSERIPEVMVLAKAACGRAKGIDPDDVWVPLTLLGISFDEGDAKAIAERIQEVRRKRIATWQIKTTLKDIGKTLDFKADDDPFLPEGERLYAELKVLAGLPA